MNSNKSLNSSVRNVGKVLARALATKSQKNPQRRNNRRPPQRTTTQALPAAYATHVRPRFSTRISGTGMQVSGCDLVYQIPSDLSVVSDEELMAIIPANPAYWVGTRIAALAQGYQNYRPKRMVFHYIPQVAVTQPGTVIMGTLWNAAAPTTGIQQTLLTSNGGCMTQCYLPCDTSVNLGRNLQQNLFQFTGALTLDTNPFIFAAIVRGSGDLPGYFYVSYDFEFRNPIGLSWSFYNSGIKPLASIESRSNTSIVLAVPAGQFGAGTILDLEGSQLYYNATPVSLAGTTLVMALSNEQSSIVPASAPKEITSASAALTYYSAGAPSTDASFIYLASDGTYNFKSGVSPSSASYPMWILTGVTGTPQGVTLYSSSEAVMYLKDNIYVSSSLISLPAENVPKHA